jgi:hypothetical protein
MPGCLVRAGKPHPAHHYDAMIDRADLETRLATLQKQRDAHRQRLRELQAAVRETDQGCAHLDGAIVVLEDILARDAQPTQNGHDEHDSGR